MKNIRAPYRLENEYFKKMCQVRDRLNRSRAQHTINPDSWRSIQLQESSRS